MKSAREVRSRQGPGYAGTAGAGIVTAAAVARDDDPISGLVGLTALVESGPIELTAVVSTATTRSVAVTCDEDVSFADGSEMLISVFAQDALYRFSGRPEVTDREIRIGDPVRTERIQRRKWPRRRLDLAVTLCPVADGLRLEGVPGRTIDLGAGGVCVETLRPVEGEGDPMVILSLPDGTSVVSCATTVSAEDLGDGWRYRLAFHDLDAHDAGRLAELAST